MDVELGVSAVTFACRSCQAKFEAYYLLDFAYGERLILTADGIEYAYLHCIDDSICDELSRILDIFLGSDISELRKGEYFDAVLDYVLDPINGKQLDATIRTRRCTKCGSCEVEQDVSIPPSIKTIKVPIVLHHGWDELDTKQQENLVGRRLESLERC